MRYSTGLLCLGGVLGLPYISNRKLESLVVNDANLVLIKTQDCNELCDMYEKTLDLIREGFESDDDSELNKVKFFMTEISANEKESFQKKFGLARLPTTLLIRGPWIYDYSGDLVKEKVIDFVNKYMEEIMTKFESEKDARKFLHDDLEPSDVRILIETDEAGRQNFEMIAGAEREFAKYGFIDSSTKGEGRGSLSVMKWGMKTPLVIGGIDFTDHNKVFKTILENQIPSITPLDIPKMRYFFMQSKGFAWIIATDEEFKTLMAELKDVVTTRGSRLHFIHVDPTKDSQFLAFINEVLKIQDRDRHIIITDVDGPGRYTYSGPWKQKSIDEYLKGALEGKLDREIQFEPVPPNDEERLIMVTKSGDRRPLPLPKISSYELSSYVAAQHDTEWIVVVPSMLCQEKVCEPMLQTLKQYTDQYNLTKLSETDCLKMVMIDGHHNEFYPEWNFPVANSPPAWFIPKRASGTAVKDFNKTELKLEQVDTLEHLTQFLDQNSKCLLPHTGSQSGERKTETKSIPDESKAKSDEL